MFCVFFFAIVGFVAIFAAENILTCLFIDLISNILTLELYGYEKAFCSIVAIIGSMRLRKK